MLIRSSVAPAGQLASGQEGDVRGGGKGDDEDDDNKRPGLPAEGCERQTFSCSHAFLQTRSARFDTRTASRFPQAERYLCGSARQTRLSCRCQKPTRTNTLKTRPGNEMVFEVAVLPAVW